MPPLDLGCYRLIHFLDRFRRSRMVQHSKYVFGMGRRKKRDWLQEHSLRRLFDDEARTGPPFSPLANGFRQDNLPFRRDGRRQCVSRSHRIALR